MTANLLAPGAIVHERYRITRAVGQGGMGAVYEAVDTRLGNTVAVKQTLVSGEQLDEAFAREARLLASLRHAALPVVSDYFAEDEARYLVMQYIPGDDFGAILERRTAPFALAEVLRWADHLLDALDYLHTQSPPIVHRDIKPQNLKLTPRGEIVLLDFGLAKSSAALTRTGSVFGYTPQYAPLEQIRGTGTDPRSDLYALAATLYHMLSNTLPPNALDRAASALTGSPDPLLPLGELNPQVPSGVSAAIARALAIDPDQRPASAAAMRAELAAALRSGSAGAATTPIDTFVAPRTQVVPPAVAPAPGAQPTGTHRPTAMWIVFGLLGAAVVLACALVGGGLFVARGLVAEAEPPATVVAEPTSRPAARPTSVAEEDVADPTPLPAPTTIQLPAIDLPAIELPALPALPAAEDDLASVTLRFGGEGTGPGRFESPRGVAIDRDGNLYVSDYTTGRVQKFDSEGQPLLSWISEGETPVLALAADRAGGVYVVRNTEVQKFDSEGALLETITDATGGGFSDLIVLSDGSMLAIPWASADVVRLDAAGREVERLESLLEERAGADTRPNRLAADGVGTFYVLGGNGTDVFVFSREGQFVDRFSVPGAWAFSDIAVDAAGRVFVSTHMEGVRVFAADGQERGSIRAPVSAFDLKFDDANHLIAVTALSEVLRLHLTEE